MKTILSAAILAALTLGAYAAEPFKVIAPLGGDADGAMARLYDYDSGAVLDSVIVVDGTATFNGTIDEPTLGRVMADGIRIPVFILEPGTISFGREGAFGSMLNDQLRALSAQLMQLQQTYATSSTDQEKEAILVRYNALMDSTLRANADNVLGYYIFLNGDAPQLPADELRAEIAKYPSFAGRGRLAKILDAADKRQATQPGNKYVDFEIDDNGTVSRLSDYVVPGKYTLVDFWASWCGPCMRQVPYLKQLQQQYGDKGLNVVGVAVWDGPDDTRAAIQSHGISWPSIINAGTVPTDLYGISGIPCIILIGPDGTILSRDKQSEELVADVEAAMQ